MGATERPRATASPSTSRAARRRALQARRHRTMLVAATVIAAVMLAAWFPATDLLHQHEQLAAATTQLHELDQKNHALERKADELQTPAAVERIAQQQYDLVVPGEEAYQVLPPATSGNGAVTGASGSSTPGALGGAGGAGGATAAVGATGATTSVSSSGGFFSRLRQTLEFWR
ncbi:MAG: FtsB family cell division protein [Acidimicrobiales bacterium]